ncbi:hypothetical protein BpHYR1_014306 [Brachionus plicatilis]|uniref:Uncharacterized protein n=1 Tax=Brachionus plicatilis TaxID=10195 RepID=A0A3M7RP34_BRAPC|nr:hypothetical protein BpHYR1_014306 [Brachionus plicatilis]
MKHYLGFDWVEAERQFFGCTKDNKKNQHVLFWHLEVDDQFKISFQFKEGNVQRLKQLSLDSLRYGAILVEDMFPRQKINSLKKFVQENFLPGKSKYPYHLYRTKKKDSRLKCAKTLIDYKA